jgi:uncharacterized protein (TIGR02246 family)
MNKLTRWLIVGCLFPAALVFGQSEEAAVREVVQKYVAARESMDARAIEALFTGDADQLVSTGEWRKGRDEVVRGSVASSKKEDGKRTIALESLRFLSPDVALGDARYDLGARHMWSTFLFKRSGGGWRIAAIRNMLPSAPAAPAK